MNTDNSNNREASNSCRVVSEYFSHNCVMDESSKKIRDNQNTPKNQTKSNKAQKRPRKRAQGQKDIRTLIKKKKNELVSYSKDFELVCKQSGIDVDPDQLQLAIALSKSLQDSEVANCEGLNTAKNLTANQRKGKIRTTLQEYGFKVPEIKTNIGKKVKRYRKHYKLLLATDNEKQQIIADKFTQILFRNISICATNDDSPITFDINAFLYNISTNITYECIRNEDIFCIPDIIQNTSNERHHMLRDWSEIPGRPPSPKQEVPNINFNNIQCSQDELASILSGTIETAQDIVKRYHKNICTNEIISEEIVDNIKKENIHTSIPEYNTTNQKSIESELLKVKKMNPENSTREIHSSSELIDLASGKNTQTITPSTNRSYSPDIFDDEVTIIMDSSKDLVHVPEEITEETTVREQNDFMDLTECVNIVNCNNSNFKQNSCLSQGSNRTRVNLNNFMDLTSCVPACSQKTPNDVQITNPNEKENYNPNVIEDNCHAESMDLTQSSSSNNSQPIADNDECGNKSLEDDTIIIIGEDYNKTNRNGNSLQLASTETDIIDLMGEKNDKSIIPLEVPEPNSVIYFVKSPKNNVHEGNNFDFEYYDEPYSPNDFFPGDMPNSYVVEENNKSNALYYNKNLDDIELGQACKLKDKSSVDIASNHESIEDTSFRGLSENRLSTPGDINYNYDDACNPEIDVCLKDYQRTDSPNNKNHENDHGFNDYLNDIPISPYRSSSKSETDNDNISGKTKNIEGLDLTQSSNSEDSIQIVLNVSDGADITDERPIPNIGTSMNCSQDDTILLNDEDYCSNSLIGKDFEDVENIRSDKITCNNHLYENSKYSNTTKEQHSISNYNNDNEFDNLIRDVSKTKQSASKISKSCDEEDLNNFNFENEPGNVNNDQFDLTQHSNCSEEKVNSPQILEISHDLENLLDENTCNDKNCEIDLTQHSDSSENNITIPLIEPNKSNNISIVYDELYIEANNRKDVIFEAPTFDKDKEKRHCSKDEVLSSSSQNSEVFEISDNEFNYSMHQHKQDNDSIRLRETRFDIGGISVINDFLNRSSLSTTKDKLKCSCSNFDTNSTGNNNQDCVPVTLECSDNVFGANGKSKSSSVVESVKISTPSKSKSIDNVLFAQTPKHSDYIIKTDQVTPMPKYELMASPERNEELDKYGIKPLKRRRAIQILTHIYNQTHPVMEIVQDSEGYSSPSKIRKRNVPASFPRRAIVTQIDSAMAENYSQVPGPSFQYSEPPLSQESSKSRKGSKKAKTSPIKSCLSPENVIDKENNLYEETKQLPDIRDIECCSEEWVFQKREKAKVHSCRVPLHVAFHNYVSCRRRLREAILRYEPINIDDIHKGLVAIGYRYNPKDLLKFMDKKCITVKTADNAKNNKK